MPLHGEPLHAPIQKPLSRAAEKQAQDRTTERDWQKVRRLVLQRDNYACRFCGSSQKVEVHHLKPRSLGREDTTSNLLVLCQIHHRERHAYRLFILGNDADTTLKFERAT